MAISSSRAQLVWSPILGWVLLSCAAAAVQAQAIETISPGRQTLDEQTPVVDIPAVPLSGPGLDSGLPAPGELGIAVGAFTLFPTLEIQAGVDSNVYATTTSPVASMYTFVRPSVELRSEWLRHEVKFLAGGGFGFYPAATNQNFQNYLFQADGRLDIRREFYATGMIAARRATEAIGTPNNTISQAPTVVDTIPLEFNLYQKFNRFFYQLTGAATRYWYYDNSIVSSGGLPAASRNRIEFDERVRLGYDVTENVAFWVTPNMGQRTYDEFVNVAGQQRDSRTWGVNLGSTVTLGPKSKLEGYVGYQALTYIVDGSSTPATVFGLSGTWNGYEPLMLRPSIIRTINESAYSNYQNYVSTTVGLDFTYDIHDAWQAVGGTSINSAAYTPATGVANVNPRTDYFWKASLGLLYSLRPQISIGPLYEHTAGWSTDVPAGGPSYTRDQFSIRLVAKR